MKTAVTYILACLAALALAVPALAADAERQRLAMEIEELRSETAARTLTNLGRVGMYYWPGIAGEPDPGWSEERKQRLDREAGQPDVERILSNRRFRKAIEELRAMPKETAGGLVAAELERTLPAYKRLFAEQWDRLRSGRQHQTSGVASIGPQLQTSDHASGRPTLKGVQLKMLALLWIAGDLRLTQTRETVVAAAREAVEQRDRFYNGDEARVYDRMLMLELAGLYNRQVLLIAIAGTADANTGEATRDAAGMEWETRHIVRFDASTTEYDLIASGGAGADPAAKTIMVTFPGVFDDEIFEAAWQASGLAPKEDQAAAAARE